jgi:hypothetical protein
LLSLHKILPIKAKVLPCNPTLARMKSNRGS